MRAQKSQQSLQNPPVTANPPAFHWRGLPLINLGENREGMDRSSVERILGGMKGTLLTYLPGGPEEALERYALLALPTGTDAERIEFRRQWREQIWRQRECLDPASARAARPFRKPSTVAMPADPPKPAGRQRGRRGKDPELQKLRDKVRRMRKPGFTQSDMCKQLDKDKEPRPPAAAWRSLTWWQAFTSRKYGRSVRKWLSDAGK
jgi:hypothetical protein